LQRFCGPKGYQVTAFLLAVSALVTRNLPATLPALEYWQNCKMRQQICGGLMALVLIGATGCGINKSRLATEQIVISDAVDRAVASIDFSPLSGRKVYFDTQYLDGVNMGPNGNIKYVVSSLRQQMLAYDCRLQEKAETAEYIVEARVGALANDGHEVTYGVPGGAAMASASVLFSSPLTAPAMPELSLGRRNHHAGTAKLGLFAYDRATREPVWQAGVTKATSEARDAWVLGLGPYQKRAAAPRGGLWWKKPEPRAPLDPLAAYSRSATFQRALAAPAGSAPQPEIATASHLQPPAPIALPPPDKVLPLPQMP